MIHLNLFFDVAIHLLPDVFRVQVPNLKENFKDLEQLSYKPDDANESAVFISESDLEKVINFKPTVYVFDKSSFFQVPTKEFVSKNPVRALCFHKYNMPDALELWKTELITVPSVMDLHNLLLETKIGFTAQD